VMLQSLFDGVYDRAGFDLAIDYDRSIPKPLLSEEDSDWVEAVVRSTSRNNS
jgi:Protein of unknown function (DUF4058)